MLKRTSLWGRHTQLGGRLIEFGGWEMPVQYRGIIEEHLAVRSAAGVFDISHMGEFLVSGAGALRFLNGALTNDLARCGVGRGQYTLMCNDAGGVVDDLYVYHLEPELYLLIVNASRIEADLKWLEAQLTTFTDRAAVKLVNASSLYGAVAVQGPRVIDFIDRCFPNARSGSTTPSSPGALNKNDVARFPFASGSVWVARTGYTGEDGFEIVAEQERIERVWDTVLEEGQGVGVKPCGLGARDTLRTEVCYPLYGHELDEKTTPLEAGLGFFVALDKGAFTGRGILAEQKAQGVSKKCVAFKMTEKSAPPRPGYPIWRGESELRAGWVTSGTQSPSLGIGIGLGYVSAEIAKPGTRVMIEIRGKLAPAEIVSKPIYRKPV